MTEKRTLNSKQIIHYSTAMTPYNCMSTTSGCSALNISLSRINDTQICHTVKRSSQVQYNYNTTAIQEFFLVLQLIAGRVTEAQKILKLLHANYTWKRKEKTTEVQLYWRESAKIVNAENNSPQQTIASKIPSDKLQTTMTVQIDSQHVEDNLI